MDLFTWKCEAHNRVLPNRTGCPQCAASARAKLHAQGICRNEKKRGVPKPTITLADVARSRDKGLAADRFVAVTALQLDEHLRRFEQSEPQVGDLVECRFRRSWPATPTTPRGATFEGTLFRAQGWGDPCLDKITFIETGLQHYGDYNPNVFEVVRRLKSAVVPSVVVREGLQVIARLPWGARRPDLDRTVRLYGRIALDSSKQIFLTDIKLIRAGTLPPAVRVGVEKHWLNLFDNLEVVEVLRG